MYGEEKWNSYHSIVLNLKLKLRDLIYYVTCDFDATLLPSYFHLCYQIIELPPHKTRVSRYFVAFNI